VRAALVSAKTIDDNQGEDQAGQDLAGRREK